MFAGPKAVVTNSAVPFEVLLNPLQSRTVPICSCAWWIPSGSMISKRKRIAFGGAARLGGSISIVARLLGVLEGNWLVGLKARWTSNRSAVHSEIWF